MSCVGAFFTVGLHYCDFNDDFLLGLQSNDLFSVKGIRIYYIRFQDYNIW